VFAVANTMIALFLMQVRGIEHSNVLVGVLWFTGGIASWLTAILELFLGNTFAWCVFGSFAGYYFAFASVLTPSFGIAAAYTDPAELNNGLGVFFCVWASLFLIFLGASVRTNLIFVWIFTLVDATAWLLAASYFQAAAGNTAAAIRLQKVDHPSSQQFS
jgi:succinate-acetate transporter protein